MRPNEILVPHNILRKGTRPRFNPEALTQNQNIDRKNDHSRKFRRGKNFLNHTNSPSVATLIFFPFFSKTVLTHEYLCKKETESSRLGGSHPPDRMCTRAFHPLLHVSALTWVIPGLGSHQQRIVWTDQEWSVVTWAAGVHVWTPLNGSKAVKRSLFGLGRDCAKDLQDFHWGGGREHVQGVGQSQVKYHWWYSYNMHTTTALEHNKHLVKLHI